MSDFKEISAKWQKKWEDSKVFEANPDKRKKFFINFPYPYINSYLHLGHAFSVTRVDVFARYKRMQGFNVLFPQSWHCTGTPVWAAAQRVKEKEPKQLKILESLGFKGKEIEKFSDVKHWIDVFVPAAKEDLKRLGASVDWRRSFITTDLNPRYDKFIRWQFRKLKEKGHVAKGTHPVVWCPKDNMPVGDHDRVEGEGETPQDFIWVKFRAKDSNLILIAGTTRPDALLGQANMWVDPKGHYVIAKVGDEKWVVGKEVFYKIENQYKKAEVIGKISPGELMGKWVKGPVVDRDLLVLPADFIDSSVGSGIVYSALEDPVDLFELKKIQSSDEIIDKYGLDKEYVKKLKPFEIIEVEGMGGNLGEDIGKEFKVKSALDKELLEEAKGELNRRVFRKGIMRKSCGRFAGKTVPQTQEILKKELVESSDAVMFYEPSAKVVCRCLTECTIKTVSDQWFLKYSSPVWKEKTRKALKNMDLYPELARTQFEYVLGWLNDWACTHHHGTGTKLPWDEDWVIESLSDSTIYMAFYTIAHLLNELPPEKIDDALFDFVFLGIGKGDKSLEKIKKEFEYWYPFDVRSSGKDLIQNHMAFCLFNHTAIFPEKYWPKSFSVNGWLLVDGEKMSKSKGNFFTIREILDKYSADIARTCLMLGGEGMNDPNFDMNNAKALDEKLMQWHAFAKENYKKSRPGKSGELSLHDRVFLSSVSRLLKEGTESMEKMLFRTAFEKLFFQMQKALRDYERKAEVSQKVINEFIELQTKAISPFCPFISEEIWSEIGKNGFASISEWPKYDESRIDEEAEAIAEYTENTRRDIIEILRLSKIQNPKSISIFIAEKWKYKFFEKLKSEMRNTRNAGQIIKSLMSTELKQHGSEISKLVPRLISDESRVPSFLLNQETEAGAIKDSMSLLEKEFKCKIVVESAEDSKEQKARQAFPSKAAILIS